MILFYYRYSYYYCNITCYVIVYLEKFTWYTLTKSKFNIYKELREKFIFLKNTKFLNLKAKFIRLGLESLTSKSQDSTEKKLSFFTRSI